MALHYVVYSLTPFSQVMKHFVSIIIETYNDCCHICGERVGWLLIYSWLRLFKHWIVTILTIVTIDSHYPISTVFREADCVIHSIEIIWRIALSTL